MSASSNNTTPGPTEPAQEPRITDAREPQAWSFRSRRLAPYIPLLGFMVIALLFGLSGFKAFQKIESVIENDKIQDLNTVADMKLEQIGVWRKAQLRRAQAFMGGSFLAGHFSLWVRSGKPGDDQEIKLRRFLTSLGTVNEYESATLFDAAGATRISTAAELAPDAAEKALAEQVMRAGSVVLTDIRRREDTPDQIVMNLAAPLLAATADGLKLVGAVVFRIDPQRHFFPIVQSWPSGSPSAEVLLVRREGDEVLFLNQLRHRSGAALTLRLPVSSPDLPSAKAMLGNTHATQGHDYRGVAVVAAVRQVPDTPWLMVAKIDRDEVFASIHRLKDWAAGLGMVFVVLGGIFLYVWLRANQERYLHLRAKKQAAVERALLVEHFESLTKYANDIILVADEDGRIVEANERALQAYGYTGEEILALHGSDLYPSSEGPDAFEQQFGKLMATGTLRLETVQRDKNGAVFPVDISARAIAIEGKTFIQAIIRDITEQKLARQRILRLKDLYSAISKTNAAIVRIRDRDALFREVCNIVVEFGGFNLAWIGLVDPSSRGLDVAGAAGGAALAYLTGIRVSSDPDIPEGQGPTGFVLQHHEPYVCNDFLADPRTRPWHEKARRFGIRASASWPLLVDGEAIGAFTFYADEPGHFSQEIVDLLGEICQATVFAVTSLKSEERRVEMERSLQRSEGELREAQRLAQVGNWSWDTAGGKMTWSEAVFQIFGLDPRLPAPSLAESARYFTAAGWRSLNGAIEKALRDGTPYMLDVEIMRPDGAAKWAISRGEPVFGPDGAIAGVRGTVQDITSHKLALEMLKRSEERFRFLAENASDMVYRMSLPEGDYEYVSPASLKLFGYTPDEFYGTPGLIRKIIHPDWQAYLDQHWAELLQGKVLPEYEYQVIHKSGQPRWMNQRNTLLHDADGAIMAIQGIVTDVTERKRAEEVQRQTAREIEDLYNLAPCGYHSLDRNGMVVRMNDTELAWLGYQRDEVVGKLHMSALQTEASRERFARNFPTFMETGSMHDLEFEFVRKDGSILHALVSATALYDAHGDFLMSRSTVYDITDRKRAEEALRLHGEIISHIQEGVVLIRAEDGIIAYANPKYEDMFGYAPGELTGQHVAILNAQTDRTPQETATEIMTALERDGRWEGDILNRRKDESKFWCHVSVCTFEHHTHGTVWVAIHLDITERRSAENRLRESEERFRSMADNAPIMIWMADADKGKGYQGCHFFNKGWHTFTGRSLEQCKDLNWLGIVHPNDRERCAAEYARAFETTQPFRLEYRLLRRDGEYRWIEDDGVPRLTRGGRLLGFIGTCVDITERKQHESMRSEMEHVRRLNIAEEMASGLAHELSQPLSAANIYLDTCLRRMDEAEWDRDKIHQAVRLAYKQAERAGKIIAHLKDVVRRQGKERSMIDLNTLARDTVFFLQEEIKRSDIEVSMALSPLPRILASKVEIELVLFNLYKNAIEAMQSCPLRELRVTTRAVGSGDIQFSISDSGSGIPANFVDDLFHPFQTSKKEGLGLGLPICRSFVENHGGRIWVETERQVGTEFHFTLPVGEA